MSNYREDIDFDLIVSDLVPQDKPRPRLVALVQSLVYGVGLLYNTLFRDWQRNVVLDLSITPQVCSLEKYINDRYDQNLKRIYIEDGVQYPWTYVFLPAELKPKYIGITSENQKQYLGLRSESGYLSVTFRVRVPGALVPVKENIRAWVNKYKLASKTFDVIAI